MKQRFLLSLFFICSFMATTRAQINKCATWIGGTVAYGKIKGEFETPMPTNTSSTFSISPAIGKVIKDNLVIGINLTYNGGKAENIQPSRTSEDKFRNYGGGLFVRQYIPVIGRFYFFGDANAGFSINKQEDIDVNSGLKSTTTTKGWSLGLGVTPGISYAITKNLQLETSLSNLFGIAYMKNKTTDNTQGYIRSYDQFAAGIFSDGKVEFNIGCRFLLNNKKG